MSLLEVKEAASSSLRTLDNKLLSLKTSMIVQIAAEWTLMLALDKE